jgi:hypothetical protein
MRYTKETAALVAAGLLLAGCSSYRTPLIAGAVDQVGIAVSGGVQDQGANATLGYRGAKFAVVPVQNENGDVLAVDDGPKRTNAFSVFALLGIDRNATVTSAVSLPDVQQVVAVGKAADIYAAGRSKLTEVQLRALSGQ